MTLSFDLTTEGARDALRARAAPEKPSLIGLTRAELGEALVASGIVPERQAKMRAQQLWHWMYVRGVSDFPGMLNISKDLRAEPRHLVELAVRLPTVDEPGLDLELVAREDLEAHPVEKPRRVRRHI